MISETCNMDLVNSILRVPEIWSAVSDEHTSIPFDTPYVRGCTYFLVNEVDGVIIFNPFRDGVEIHPNILPLKRGKDAYQAIEDSIQEMFKRGHSSIYAQIAVELKNVIQAAKHSGFRLLESSDREIFIRRRLNS